MAFSADAMAARAACRQAFVVHDHTPGGIHSVGPSEKQQQGHAKAGDYFHAGLKGIINANAVEQLKGW